VPREAIASRPPGIAQQWPTLLLIKLGRITMYRFTEALEPFGLRPRHLAALIELRDRGELTQQSLCGQLHLDPTNLVAILNELEASGTRLNYPPDTCGELCWMGLHGLVSAFILKPEFPWSDRELLVKGMLEIHLKGILRT
jgi:hypothetical protein